MLIKKSIKPLDLYDKIIIEKYSNQVELANKFSVYKTTIFKYIKLSKLFKSKIYFRLINFIIKIKYNN